jgi:murein DD-endopeptidase MepM/ murein hydrolase activator NlpD
MNNSGLSLFVVGISMMLPMAMYADSNEKLKTMEQGRVVLENGTSVNAEEYLSYLGGAGGPAVGLEDIIGTTSVINSSGAPAEIVKVDKFDEINQAGTARKLVYLKVAETVWPVQTVAISSDYGYRDAPCAGCSSDHQGVDFVPGAGTNVFAVYQGLVTKAGWDGGYGNRVEISHFVEGEDGEIQQWTTIYAHMQDSSIAKNIYVGAVVQTGAVLGRVGSTGTSTGPHLHFELIIDGNNVDPMPVLGHYNLIELTEEEAAQITFSGNLPELNFFKNK